MSRKSVLAGVVAWDWKSQPVIDEIDRIIANISHLKVRAYEVETGSDEYAVVFADGDLDAADVQRAYDAYRAGADRDGFVSVVPGGES